MPQVQDDEGEAVVIYRKPSSRLRSLSYGGPSNAGLSAELLRKAGDAVLSAFPNGKQQAEKSIELACHRK